MFGVLVYLLDLYIFLPPLFIFIFWFSCLKHCSHNTQFAGTT